MNKSIKHAVRIALIAALYAVFTFLSASLGLAYGNIQLRISEALMILCAFSSDAVAGVVIGCALANIASPFGPADMLIGSAATLAAALLIRTVAARVTDIRAVTALSVLMTAAVNGIAVGAETAFIAGAGQTPGVFFISAAEVVAGELIVGAVLGPLIVTALKKNKSLNLYFCTERSCEASVQKRKK